MERIIGRRNKTGIQIEPWVFQGAKLQDVSREAMYYTSSRPFDLIFMCAGIFDIIDMNSTTGTYSFRWASCEHLITYILMQVELTDAQFLKERPATKVIYCPIMGVNLNLLLQKESETEQAILNEGIWALNRKFFELNNKRGFFCPNTAKPVHRIIKGKMKNCYHHLGPDGLKLTEDLETSWADEMIKATGHDKTY